MVHRTSQHSIPIILILVLATLGHITPAVSGLVREYYVAAETIDWDYSNGQNQSSDYVFKKIIYKEYEQGFLKAKPGSQLTGILGPTLRAEVGDVLKVHFKNKATKPLTIHPQGITYGKMAEGAKYADGTPPMEKLDDSVLPGQTYIYSWDISENMGPKDDDPDCLTSIYYSADNMVQDVNSGLIGALLICKTGSLKDDGSQKNFNKDFVLFFAVFDESKSWGAFPSPKPRPVMYTINGYVQGTGPDFKACLDDKISWHILGMSSKPEFFSVHFVGQTLLQNKHRVSVVRLVSSSSITTNMTVTQAGRWKILSFIEKHIEAGMEAHLDVQPCAEKVRSSNKQSVFKTRYIKKWENYIAAVEVDWDYTKGQPDSSETNYCHQPFKKVIYTQYTDSSFTTQTERLNLENGLLGPVIRAQVKDTIMVVFKNMASQPHNIYPHGVSLQRFFKGYAPDLKGEELQNNTVMPGETITYYWTVLDIDEPTKNDPQCLTRIYHSTVNIVKDMASGLLGTLLICKSMALNTRGLQEKADEEQIAMFSVFDENKSWYYEENKLRTCSWMLTKDPSHLHNSYIINTINGNTFEKAILGFCHSHVVQWHVSSTGIWDETLTLQFSGHTFSYRGGNGDLITLFPMTSESIITEMNNQGVWIFGNLNFKEKPGMKVRFRDAKCVSHDDYDEDAFVNFDYDDDDVDEVKVRTGEDDKSEIEITTTYEDDYTDDLASHFNIRSVKSSNKSTEEEFNLTALINDMFEFSDEESQYNHTTVRVTENDNSILDGNLIDNFINEVLSDIINQTKEIFQETKESNIIGQNRSGTGDAEDIQIKDLKEMNLTEMAIHEQANETKDSETQNKTGAKDIENTIQPNDSEDNNLEDELQSVISDQTKELFNNTKEFDLLHQNSKATEKIENIMQLNDSAYIKLTDELEDISPGQPMFNETKENVLLIHNRTGSADIENIIITNNEHDLKNNSQPASSEDEKDAKEQEKASEAKQHIHTAKRDVEMAENATYLDFSDENAANGSKEVIQDKVSTELPSQLEKGEVNLTTAATSAPVTKPNVPNVDQVDDIKHPTTSVLPASIPISPLPASIPTSPIPPSKPTTPPPASIPATPPPAYILTTPPPASIPATPPPASIPTTPPPASIPATPPPESIPATPPASTPATPPPASIPTTPLPTFMPKGHPALTTPKAAEKKASAENSISGYHDKEMEDMLGTQIFEDIMKTILQHSKKNGTNSTTPESVEENRNELPNQSSPRSDNVTTQPIAQTENIPKRKIIYVKKMVKFQIEDPSNDTSSVRYVRRERQAGKFKGKRTVNNSYDQQNRTQSDTGDYGASNASLADGNITLTPRGFSPRGIDPRGPRKMTPEIRIGVPTGGDGTDYEEHDPNSKIFTENEETPKVMVGFEEPYKIVTDDDLNRYTNPDRIIEHYLRSSKGTQRVYYIAAEEVQWDYSGQNIRYNINEKPVFESKENVYKKVIFRRYLDAYFTKPDVEGEYEDHLGILGPVIRAEVEDVIQVIFKNKASRPYSIHAHGVAYEKSSEGYSYADETDDWFKTDDLVEPNKTYVYVWYATKQSGPEPEGSACRTWAYHSGVNIEKDIHSGLIGPLLICRAGTLDKKNHRPIDAREFILLFMTFEEEKSWYFDKSKKTCKAVTEKQPNTKKCHVYHAINGIIYNLQGLQMYQNELVRWHLLNMGSAKDSHVINFHGQTVTESLKTEHRLAVYPLTAGSFATVEMIPSRAGLWQLDTEVAEYQQAGMQAIFNIAEAVCNYPLGLANRLISDDQITASNYINYWEPKLARLNNAGSYNAWSTDMNMSTLPWIQVDLLRTYLISAIQTQGANKYFSQYYITEFFVVYSKDKKKWSAFRGNSTASHQLFQGNADSSTVKENTFDPPIAARYIRVYPTQYYNKPALRMELLGCEIQGCSAPLGMETYQIKDDQITASSYKSSWYSSSWLPSLARLNKAGSVNAWQAKSNNNQQWLQINLLTVKKVTGIMTQGAKQLTTEMYVQSYAIHYSDNGKNWKPYIDESTSMEKIFKGNRNSAGYAKNDFNPPIYSQFLRIIPKSWNSSIVMRVELYGCDV